jgi:hypothetical protein
METLDAPACLANIGPAQRRLRLRFGAVALAMTLGALVALALTGVDRGWRLALFLPFFTAATGYFQARERT